MPCLIGCMALCALAVSMAGCCGPDINYDYATENARTGAYRVGPGDVLRISVWGQSDLSGNATVRPDGQITLALVGEVLAAERTPTEIQQEIARRLQRYVKTNPNVTVTVAQINSYRVYVMGRVNQAGEYTPDAPVTVLQALALARGLNEYADPNHIVIVRRDEGGTVRRIPFVYAQAVKCGRVEMDITLSTGDTVVVP